MAAKTVRGTIADATTATEIVALVSGKVLKVKYLEVGLANEKDSSINVNLEDNAATPVVLMPSQALDAGAPIRCRCHNGYMWKSTQSKNLALKTSAAKKIYYVCIYDDADAS